MTPFRIDGNNDLWASVALFSQALPVSVALWLNFFIYIYFLRFCLNSCLSCRTVLIDFVHILDRIMCVEMYSVRKRSVIVYISMYKY